MRRRLSELGLPVPDFADLSGERAVARDALVEFGVRHGWDIVIKAVRGGYDGRGVWLLDDQTRALEVFDEAQVSAQLMVEAKVPMRRELSALVARSPFGQGAAWPVVETIQRHGQCAVVLAPAPGLAPEVAERAQQMALRLADELGVVGVMAMELFETDDGELVVNELAMRPHNSGLFTLGGVLEPDESERGGTTVKVGPVPLDRDLVLEIADRRRTLMNGARDLEAAQTLIDQIEQESLQRGRQPKDVAEASSWARPLPTPPDDGVWVFDHPRPEVRWPAPAGKPWDLRGK